MNKDRLKEIMLNQKEVFSGKINLIDRDIVLDEVHKYYKIAQEQIA